MPLADSRDPDTLAVVLGDGVPMFEAAVPARVFGVSVPTRGLRARTVLVVSEHDAPVTTTAGVQLSAPHPLAADARAGTVVVPGWRPLGEEQVATPVLEALQQARDEGAVVVGLCLGAFVLAAAGLLDGLRATTHWAHTAELAAAYPQVDVDGDVLYVDEGQVLTSAGSAAGIDACLHLLRRQSGPEAAVAAARSLVVAPQRAGGQAQYVDRPVPAFEGGDPVSDLLAYAVAHLDDPDLHVESLAAKAQMTRRTFDRRFREVTGSSALQWLTAQRVIRAQELLEQTELPVDQVARCVGFSDAVALRPHFRRVVGVPPQTYRKTFSPHA